MNKTILFAAALLVAVTALPGCAKNRQKLTDAESKAQELQRRLTESEKARQALIDSMRRQQKAHDDEMQSLEARKEQEVDRLVDAERALAESLRRELGDARAKLERTERGLVLTLLDEIFFDSGKAVVKEEGFQTLEKVAEVLRDTVPDSSAAIEGHTDNEPIRYSSWLSNWELSAGRALAVLHRFIDQNGIAPERLQAVARGEFHPVADNSTAEGRRQNRRVEIVILPAEIKKVKE